MLLLNTKASQLPSAIPVKTVANRTRRKTEPPEKSIVNALQSRHARSHSKVDCCDGDPDGLSSSALTAMTSLGVPLFDRRRYEIHLNASIDTVGLSCAIRRSSGRSAVCRLALFC